MRKMITWIVILLVFSVFFSCEDKTQKISYETNLKRASTRVIVIRPENRNVDDLKILGRQLSRENSKETIALIFVYDNKMAANLFSQSTLSEEQEELHTLHFLGSYTKNNNNRLHEFKVYLSDNEGGNF
jgi:hypothetical protein